MITSDIQPPTGIDHHHDGLRSALANCARVAFIVIVALGSLAGTGLVLWLLSMLAHSSYGVYFGV
ncbi:MAG: hypothetical protein WAN71_00635 [Mycobacterium sp.]|uniref:hypothetical protein n=1 Tax=Mycobacterium sp. TaxID=1785 RepID=UPI003BAF9D93